MDRVTTPAEFQPDVVISRSGIAYVQPKWARISGWLVRTGLAGLALMAGALTALMMSETSSTWWAPIVISFAIAIFLWPKAKLVGFWRGNCPHCSRETYFHIAPPAPEAYHNCPACQRRVAVRPGQFEAL